MKQAAERLASGDKKTFIVFRIFSGKILNRNISGENMRRLCRFQKIPDMKTILGISQSVRGYSGNVSLTGPMDGIMDIYDIQK